jgi:hypothetical protein
MVRRAASTAVPGTSSEARSRQRVSSGSRCGRTRSTSRANRPTIGRRIATPSRLYAVWRLANRIDASTVAAPRTISAATRGNSASITPPVTTLKSTCASAVRLAAVVAPNAAKAELMAVPMFCPITSAAAWSGPTAPACSAEMVAATAALEDCITVVIRTPTSTSIATPAAPLHHPLPLTAGRSAGCTRSANPAMPPCNTVSPSKSSENPAIAPPAPPQRPRPISRSSAPAKSMGMAAGASETLTPRSATSQPVPVVPMLAPKTTPIACGKVRRPALTSPIVVIVVALEDCTISVMTAPHSVPRAGVAAAVCRSARRAEPANARRPSVMIHIPSRNSPSPPRIAMSM